MRYTNTLGQGTTEVIDVEASKGDRVFFEAKKVGQQLKYADRRGFRVALIAGPDEFAQGVWNVKDLASATQRVEVPEAEVAAVIRQMLGE